MRNLATCSETKMSLLELDYLYQLTSLHADFCNF